MHTTLNVNNIHLFDGKLVRCHTINTDGVCCMDGRMAIISTGAERTVFRVINGNNPYFCNAGAYINSDGDYYIHGIRNDHTIVVDCIEEPWWKVSSDVYAHFYWLTRSGEFAKRYGTKPANYHISEYRFNTKRFAFCADINMKYEHIEREFFVPKDIVTVTINSLDIKDADIPIVPVRIPENSARVETFEFNI